MKLFSFITSLILVITLSVANNVETIDDESKIIQDGYFQVCPDGLSPICSEGYYKNGLKEGLHVGFHEKGNKSWEGHFVKNKRHGLFKYYYSNGKIYITRNFLDDELHGEQVYYDSSDGTVTDRYFYEKGKLIKGIWYKKDGTVEKEGPDLHYCGRFIWRCDI